MLGRRQLAIAFLLSSLTAFAQVGTPVRVVQIGTDTISLYDTLFSATSATATQTSSAVRIPGFSGYGSFSVVFAGLTGSPAGCQFAFEYQQNTGTAASSAFFTQAVTPSSSYQSFTVNPSAGFNAGDKVIAVYSCGTYPTAGTMTLSYNPTGQGPIPAGTNVIGHVVADTGSTTAVTQATAANLNDTATQGPAAAITAGWPIVSGALTEVTAAWTSATSGNTTLRETTTGYGVVEVFLNQGTTLTGGVVTFEGSDTAAFTNSYPILCSPANNFAAAATYTLIASTNQAFECEVSGFNAFQVRLSTVITGTGTVNVGMVAKAMPSNPDVTVGGTVTTTPPANASTNVAQLAGTTADTNSGAKSAGTLRVVLATDQPALTNKLLVTPDSVALPANQSVNVSQVNGVTPLMGNGTTGTGSQRVTIASDNIAFSVNAAGILSDNNAAPSTTNEGAMPCVARTDLRAGTAATAGRLIFPDCGTDGLQHVTALPDLSMKRYRASSKFAGSSTTDNWRISGNASNTVIVTKLSVTCTETTAGQVSVALVKRSTAGSGGTAASVAAVPLDSNKAAASSVVNSYTGTGPTVGTPVGDVDDAQFGCMAAATATPNDIYIPATSPGAPIAVLRGTAEGLALNFGGAITGGNLTVSVEWAEVTTVTP